MTADRSSENDFSCVEFANGMLNDIATAQRMLDCGWSIAIEIPHGVFGAIEFKHGLTLEPVVSVSLNMEDSEEIKSLVSRILASRQGHAIEIIKANSV